jgi:hypothetical protein
VECIICMNTKSLESEFKTGIINGDPHCANIQGLDT